MLKLKSRFQLLLSEIFFIIRNPKTVILGGPSLLRVLGRRHQNLPSSFFSQAGQDTYLLMQYFKQISNPEFPKIFLDVGCNHPVRHNNSYFFEKYMGFKVIGVDALEKYENEWKTIRPNADLVVTAVGDRDGTLEFEETEHDGYEGDMYSAVKGYSNKAEKLKRVGRIVPVKTLTNILKSRNIIDIGIMSLDIEGYELSALQGIDTNSIRIQIVILENNSNNLLGNEKVRKFMRSKGYVLKARIWGLDDVYEHKCLNRQPQRD